MRRPVCLFALIFTAAVCAAVLFLPSQQDICLKAEGRYVTLQGVVGDKEYALNSPGNEQYLRMTLENVTSETEVPRESAFEIKRGDKIMCILEDEPETQEKWAAVGAIVRIRGKIRLFKRPSNDGEFDAFLYYREIGGYLFTLADAHILSYNNEKDPLRAPLYDLRKYLTDTLDRIYSYKYGSSGRRCASILKAMLLGQNSLVEKEIRERYQAAGIIHVICVSGLHISVIGSGIYAFLRKCRVPPALSCVLTVLFLYLYGILTGMHTSCVRALVMFGMRSAAKALGRTYDMPTGMAAAAVLLLIEQPMYLFHSGFLFSFAAVAAAAILVPELPGPAKPFAIPLFTIPVHLCIYYSFPVYSVLLSWIVIFLAPFAMAAGAVSLLLGAAAGLCCFGILPPMLSGAASLAAEIPVLILWLYDFLCGVQEKLPFHILTVGKPPDGIVVLYYFLLALAVILPQLMSACGRKKRLAQFVICAAALIMIFTIRFEPPMALYMLDVGQGDGLCIRTGDESGGVTVLIDGGSSSKNGVGTNIEIPFLKYHGVDKIDLCIMTHDDLDHCSGLLELLDQSDAPGGIRIVRLGVPSVAQDRKGETYRRIERAAAQKKIPVTYLRRGMTLTEGKLKLECLHPAPDAFYEDTNEYSAVMMVTYEKFSAILTGDLEGQGESDMLEFLEKKRLAADILKVAHHGSKGGTSERFLSQIASKTALISCGTGNRYGHPAPETVERLLEAGMEIWDTREDGQITVTTDGRGTYSIHTFY